MSKDCPNLSGMLRMKRHGKDKQASQVWVFLPTATEWGPPRRNLENSTKSQKRLDLQIFFFFPQKTLSLTFFRVWRGTLKVLPCESSLLSFLLLPALHQGGILTVGRDLGCQNPHNLIKQQTDFWCVLETGMWVAMGWRGKSGKTLEPEETRPQGQWRDGLEWHEEWI